MIQPVGPRDVISIPQRTRDVLSLRNMTQNDGWKHCLGPQTLWQLHDTILTQIEKILEIRYVLRLKFCHRLCLLTNPHKELLQNIRCTLGSLLRRRPC